jgi:hypothetical protein
MTNRAYWALWGKVDTGALVQDSGPGTIDGWRQKSAPSLLWNDLADYVGSFDEREPWDGEFRLLDGRLVACKVSALPQGSTMVAFSIPAARADLRAEDPPAAMLIA